MNEVSELTEEILPRFYLSSCVITIWALFELSVSTLTDYLGKREGARLLLSDIRGRSLRDRVKKYFEAVLKIECPIQDSDWNKLTDLQEFRNCLAHSNGRLLNDVPNRNDKIMTLVNRTSEVDLKRGVLSFNQEYVLQALSLVREALAAIDSIIAERCEWPQIIYPISIDTTE